MEKLKEPELTPVSLKELIKNFKEIGYVYCWSKEVIVSKAILSEHRGDQE